MLRQCQLEAVVDAVMLRPFEEGRRFPQLPGFTLN
jgi:hypothetical protein